MKRDLPNGKEAKKVSRTTNKTAVLNVEKKPKTPRVSVRARKVEEPVTKTHRRTVKTVVSKSEVKKPSALPGKKSKSLSKRDDPSEAVFIPSTASLRLLEKVELYKLWYEQSLPREVRRFAVGAGYSFVILGTVFASSSYLVSKFNLSGSAAIVCASDECVEVPDDNLVPSAPLVTFLNTLPETLTNDADIVLRSKNGEEPTFSLRNLKTGDLKVIEPTEKMSNGEFRYLITYESLTHGVYEVTAELSADQTNYAFSGPVFAIDQGVTQKVEPLIASVVETGSSSDMVPEEDVASTSLATALLEERVSDRSLSRSPIYAVVMEELGNSYLSIKTGDYSPESVSVYAKINGTATKILLGEAYRSAGEWVFSLSAIDLPLIKFDLFAAFTSQGRVYQTESVSHQPSTIQKVNLTSVADLKNFEEKISLTLKTAEVNNDIRKSYYSHIASTTPQLFDTQEEMLHADAALISEADSLLLRNEALFNNLLFKYAVAIQGQSDFLKKVAIAAIENEIRHQLEQEASSASFSALETLLLIRIDTLFGRVKEMEERVAEQTNLQTSIDSDSDGLSDFDEIANFSTSPTTADSDGDSIIDSIEIVYASNALVADLLTLPNFLERGIEIDANSLAIVGITSSTHLRGAVSGIYPVVHGRALPNSLIYLNIAGTDKVGVVRVGTEGHFTYTFETPLALATYEMVAAYVSAEGLPVLQTKPMQFTLKEEGLAAGALFSNTVSFGSTDTSKVPFVVLLSVLVVVLGFVLLLLAESLIARRRKEI